MVNNGTDCWITYLNIVTLLKTGKLWADGAAELLKQKYLYKIWSYWTKEDVIVLACKVLK